MILRISSFLKVCYIALPAFNVLKQLVQMCIFLDVPLTTVLTGLTFAFQVLLDLLWEWLTLMPNATPLPQISHFAIYMHLLLIITKNYIPSVVMRCLQPYKLNAVINTRYIVSKKIGFGKLFLKIFLKIFHYSLEDGNLYFFTTCILYQKALSDAPRSITIADKYTQAANIIILASEPYITW